MRLPLSDILAKTRDNWRGLADVTTGKGPNSKSHLLDQAVQQKNLNLSLKELHEWLDMAEMRLASETYIHITYTEWDLDRRIRICKLGFLNIIFVLSLIPSLLIPNLY